MLMQLTAGTLFTQTTFGATGFSGTRAWDVNGSLSIHGSRTGNNEFLIEGAPSSGTGGGTGNWNYAPPVDAIEEFKVSTSSVDASFGRTSGGVVNMTFRSGTNQLRGSGIVLHRGTWLDANQIQNIRNNISNKGHKYFNGESMVSGPIRRNKTFFMGGYQGFYENIPFPVTRTIPTEAQLRGDFSQTTTANGTPILIYDPATTACTADFSGCTRQPFPGNIIPEARWNPIARALLPFIPRPNATPSNLSGSSNFISSPNLGRYRYNSYLTRIDHVFSNNHRLSFSNTANWGSSTATRTRCRSRRSAATTIRPTATTTCTVDDNRTINSTTLGTARLVGPVRRAARQGVRRHRSEAALPGPLPADRPAVPADQHRRLRRHVPADVPAAEERRLLGQQQPVEDHGPALREDRRRVPRLPVLPPGRVNSNGVFGFNNDFTRRDPLSNTGAASGNGLATFLLGLPTSGSVHDRHAAHRAVPLLRAVRAGRLEARLARDAQRRPALGLPAAGHGEGQPDGVGLRRQRRPIRCSRSCRRARRRSTRRPASRCTLKGGLLFANRGGPKSPYKSDWNNIQPRVGFTYQVNDWLVGAHQLRPLVSSDCRAAARTASTPPTSSGRRRSSRRRRTASIRGRRGPTRSPPASCSRSPASWGC